MQVYWVDGETGEIGTARSGAHSLLRFSRIGRRDDRDRGLRERALLGAHAGVAGSRGATGATRGTCGRTFAATRTTRPTRGRYGMPPINRGCAGCRSGRAATGVLALHRVRSQWVKARTQMVNGLRGLLYGWCCPGRQAGLKAIAASRGQLDAGLPEPMRALIDGQFEMLGAIERRIEAIEAQLQALAEPASRARGVCGRFRAWASGGHRAGSGAGRGCQGVPQRREFAAAWGWCPGIQAPEQGEHRKLSKRGDPYLRTLLMHGRAR